MSGELIPWNMFLRMIQIPMSKRWWMHPRCPCVKHTRLGSLSASSICTLINCSYKSAQRDYYAVNLGCSQRGPCCMRSICCNETQEGHFVSSNILSSPSKGRKQEGEMRVLCWVMLTSCTAPDGALVVLVICWRENKLLPLSSLERVVLKEKAGSRKSASPTAAARCMSDKFSHCVTRPLLRFRLIDNFSWHNANVSLYHHQKSAWPL